MKLYFEWEGFVANMGKMKLITVPIAIRSQVPNGVKFRVILKETCEKDEE